MPVTNEFSDFYTEMRRLLKDVWDLTSTDMILETGNEPVEVEEKVLPLAIMQLEGEILQSRGPAAMDITSSFSMYLWYVKRKTRGRSAVSSMREDITKLVTKIWEDPHLNLTVNNVEPLAVSWTGEGRQWPVEIGQGVVASAGYAGFTFQLIESRLPT